MVHCSESGIDISTSELFSVALGACLLLVLFLREDIDHFGFCLVRLLVGEVWLAAVDCFCGWFAEGRL